MRRVFTLAMAVAAMLVVATPASATSTQKTATCVWDISNASDLCNVEDDSTFQCGPGEYVRHRTRYRIFDMPYLVLHSASVRGTWSGEDHQKTKSNLAAQPYVNGWRTVPGVAINGPTGLWSLGGWSGFDIDSNASLHDEDGVIKIRISRWCRPGTGQKADGPVVRERFGAE